jgi:cyclopropane-fatty-acyl-phospholipid synthase
MRIPLRNRAQHAKSAARTASKTVAPLIDRLALNDGGGLPFTLRFWDDSELRSGAPLTLVIRTRRALEHVLREPNELGLARAWVVGDLDVEGGVENGLRAAEGLRGLRLRIHDQLALAIAAARLGAVRLRRPMIPASEARLAGRRTSLRRDRAP